MSDLKAAVMDMLRINGWSADWQERSAVLHGEAAELTDAVRGKRGDPLEESADVLISLRCARVGGPASCPGTGLR